MGPPSTHSASSSVSSVSSDTSNTAVDDTASPFEISPEVILPAQSPSIGVFQQHVREKETSIEMIKQGRWYGYASYDIRDSSGEVVLKSELTRGSLSSRKLISDVGGNPLYNITSKTISWGQTYIATSANGEENELFTIKGPKNCLSCGLKLQIHLTNTTSSHPIDLVLNTDRRGNGLLHMDGQEHGDRALAIVQYFKESNPKKSGYRARIAGGVDVALVAAIVMALHGVEAARQASHVAVVV